MELNSGSRLWQVLGRQVEQVGRCPVVRFAPKPNSKELNFSFVAARGQLESLDGIPSPRLRLVDLMQLLT